MQSIIFCSSGFDSAFSLICAGSYNVLEKVWRCREVRVMTYVFRWYCTVYLPQRQNSNHNTDLHHSAGYRFMLTHSLRTISMATTNTRTLLVDASWTYSSKRHIVKFPMNLFKPSSVPQKNVKKIKNSRGWKKSQCFRRKRLKQTWKKNTPLSHTALLYTQACSMKRQRYITRRTCATCNCSQLMGSE